MTANEQGSHAGPVTLKCNRDGLPALAGAAGWPNRWGSHSTYQSGTPRFIVDVDHKITTGIIHLRAPSEVNYPDVLSKCWLTWSFGDQRPHNLNLGTPVCGRGLGVLAQIHPETLRCTFGD